MEEKEEFVDDGSLACLNIPRNENNRIFHCDKTTQSMLANTTFWVVDYLVDVPTRFTKPKGSSGQTLVLIKPQKDSPNSEAKKFFTGSQEILYTLNWLREHNKFPRRVTLRHEGNRYWFE